MYFGLNEKAYTVEEICNQPHMNMKRLYTGLKLVSRELLRKKRGLSEFLFRLSPCDEISIVDNRFPIDENLWSDSFNRDLLKVLNTLNKREKLVIIRFYGLFGYESEDLTKIGARLDLSRERTRQIKEKALRRLRNVRRRGVLEQYL